MAARDEQTDTRKDQTDEEKQQEQEQQEQQEQQQEKRVELGDVVRVLAKHAAQPNDPDDADLLGRFNAQEAEGEQEPASTRTGQEGKSEQEQDEGPQQGSPQKGSPTAKPGSSTGARREKP